MSSRLIHPQVIKDFAAMKVNLENSGGIHRYEFSPGEKAHFTIFVTGRNENTRPELKSMIEADLKDGKLCKIMDDLRD